MNIQLHDSILTEHSHDNGDLKEDLNKFSKDKENLKLDQINEK